jgi:hypothetical protein
MKQYLTYDKSIPTGNSFYGYGKDDSEALYNYSLLYIYTFHLKTFARQHMLIEKEYHFVELQRDFFIFFGHSNMEKIMTKSALCVI